MKLRTKRLYELMGEIFEFNRRRGWDPVAEDLAKSIVMESSELLEHFQWDASHVARGNNLPRKDLREIGYEVADVFWYLVLFCEKMGLDLVDVLEKKMKHNNVKFPVEKFKNGHDEEFYRQQKKKYRSMKGGK